MPIIMLIIMLIIINYYHTHHTITHCYCFKVLRSADVRKGIIHALKKVELFKSLSIQQIQRLADLMNETSYKAGEYIIKQGDIGDSFFLILSGICDCTKDLSNGQSIFLVQRKEYEYFGERALLNSEPRAANVIAKTNVKVLFIGKQAFDEVLGSLTDIINEDRLRREALATAILEAPKQLQGIDIKAIVSTDDIGPLLLASFRSQIPNLSIRTFILSESDSKGFGNSVVNFIDTVRYVTLNPTQNPLVPRLHSATKDSNAIHLLFRESIIGDLSSILSLNNRSTNSLLCSNDIQVYIIASLISALESLHSMGIIYRAIQPEGISVDINGKVLLMDYRVSKLTNINGKTFTICGAADYLAPEQISQVGHTSSVDFWSLGVLLYELVTGIHPFSSPNGEIATYTKIASFGTIEFPSLTYPNNIPIKITSFIDNLVQAIPEKRLGTQQMGGYRKLQRTGILESFDWSKLSTMSSPLKDLAQLTCDEILRTGVDPTVIASFSENFHGASWTKKIEL